MGPIAPTFVDVHVCGVWHDTYMDNMVAEGDFVVVQSRGAAQTKDDRPYDNTYCHVMRIRDGKIAELTEYLDTELASSVLD